MGEGVKARERERARENTPVRFTPLNHLKHPLVTTG